MNIAEILEQLDITITPADIILGSAGVILLCIWLIKYSFGTKALADSPPRRNNMPIYLPILFLTIWIILAAGGLQIINSLGKTAGLAQWQKELLIYSSMSLSQFVLIFLMLFVGWRFFAGRLKGFGFCFRTVGKDLAAAIVNLVAILPVVAGMMLLVGFLGRLIEGEQFQIQQNEGLTTIISYPQLSVRIVVFIFAGVIVPVFEELIFRGLFQSMLRSAICKAWPAIILSSVLFSILHPWTHWPALFAFSLCLGYSYEKSGSMFRPIFIHALFNIIMLAAALNSG